MTSRQKSAFLARTSAGENSRSAAMALGIPWSIVRQTRNEDDTFRTAWDSAVIEGTFDYDAVTVHPGIPLQRRGQSLLQVFERLAAPVAADRVAKRLAVPGRTVKVDHDRGVASAGVRLRVPPIVKVVAERTLRPAVNQERHGVFL